MRLISILIATFASGVFVCHSQKQQLTGCDHPSGWCNEIRETAAKSWRYAQLSSNVYNDSFRFKVDDYFDKIREYSLPGISFFACLYRDKSSQELVLVFRGTDSFRDFATGNNPFKQLQNRYALSVYDEIKTKYLPNKIVVAGHSLGGGIAIHISLNRENIIAYSFNGSPVFRNQKGFENERYSIVENGEILKLLRLFGREADQIYTSIGCNNGNPVKQHAMKKFATCLTQIGGIEDPEAKNSLQSNGIPFDY